MIKLPCCYPIENRLRDKLQEGRGGGGDGGGSLLGGAADAPRPQRAVEVREEDAVALEHQVYVNLEQNRFGFVTKWSNGQMI